MSSQLRKNIKTRVIQATSSENFRNPCPCFYRSLAVVSEFVKAAVHLFFLPVHSASSVAATLPPQTPDKVIFASSFLMAQMMSKMGCHRRLELCSPAKSLRLRVCYSFCNSRVTVAFFIAATGAEMAFLSLSFNSATFTLPRQEPLCPYPEPVEGHLFSLCFLPFQSFRCTSFLQPHQQLTLAVGITPHRAFSQPPFNQPKVFPTQSNANKNMRQTLVHTA